MRCQHIQDFQHTAKPMLFNGLQFATQIHIWSFGTRFHHLEADDFSVCLLGCNQSAANSPARISLFALPFFVVPLPDNTVSCANVVITMPRIPKVKNVVFHIH